MGGEQRFATPGGAIELHRRPHRPSSPLRAWDAADEYVLTHLAEHPPPASAVRWLVVNDAFGALGVALADHRPWWWSDSAVAHAALAENLTRNGHSGGAVIPIAMIDDPPHAPDVVVVKIPKSRSLLEDQLGRLRAVLRPETVVIGAGMTRHVHSSTVACFEALVGPTRTTIARRRARLVLARVEGDAVPAEPSPSPPPVHSTFRVDADLVRAADDATTSLSVHNHAGVFSSRRLDIGTRFLLEQLPDVRGASRVVDLGCGNGVVGTVVALRNPTAEVVFADESSLAIASAHRTFREACGARASVFSWGEGAAGVADASVDLVVLNPPFHDQHVVDADAGRTLVGEAHRILAPGGRLVVVANRHVGHHVTMARRFGDKPVVLASNPKFVVLASSR